MIYFNSEAMLLEDTEYSEKTTTETTVEHGWGIKEKISKMIAWVKAKIKQIVDAFKKWIKKFNKKKSDTPKSGNTPKTYSMRDWASDYSLIGWLDEHAVGDIDSVADGALIQQMMGMIDQVGVGNFKDSLRDMSIGIGDMMVELNLEFNKKVASYISGGSGNPIDAPKKTLETVDMGKINWFIDNAASSTAVTMMEKRSGATIKTMTGDLQKLERELKSLSKDDMKKARAILDAVPSMINEMTTSFSQLAQMYMRVVTIEAARKNEALAIKQAYESDNK